MTEEQAKENIKARLPDYLKNRGIDINKRKNFRCLNPEHNDSNPSMSFDKEHCRVHCFGCGASYDTFDLIGLDYGIKGKELFEKAFDLFGVSVDEGKGGCLDWSDEISTHSKPKSDNTHFITQCQKNLPKAADYLQSRGISLETAKRFGLGYCENQSIQGLKMNAVIIPTGGGQYVARNTDKNAAKANRYRKSETTQLFNAQALYSGEYKDVFIVEGEFDALSISEVGGQAVALGSTASVHRFIDTLKKRPTDKRLIIALDNDEAGKKAQNQLCEELENIKSDFMVCDILTKGFKDANEALINNREEFQSIVSAPSEKLYIKSYSISAYMHAYLEEINKKANDPIIKTGFEQLDKALDGGLYAGLYFIGAISSLGKTTFAMQIADNIAGSGQDVMIFSLEMSKSQLISKSVSRLSFIGNQKRFGATSRRISAGQKYSEYSADYKSMIKNSINEYSTVYSENVFIVDGVGDIGAKKIRETVDRHIRATGRKPVVFIDYLQILAPFNDRYSDKQNADRNVTELKRISNDFDIPVFCISSFNRDNYGDTVKMSSFKESGGIEYGADVLFGLQLHLPDTPSGSKKPSPDFLIRQAKQRNPREIELHILKNREGETGTIINYHFNAAYNYFEEVKDFKGDSDFEEYGA